MVDWNPLKAARGFPQAQIAKAAAITEPLRKSDEGKRELPILPNFFGIAYAMGSTAIVLFGEGQKTDTDMTI